MQPFNLGLVGMHALVNFLDETWMSFGIKNIGRPSLDSFLQSCHFQKIKVELPNHSNHDDVDNLSKTSQPDLTDLSKSPPLA